MNIKLTTNELNQFKDELKNITKEEIKEFFTLIDKYDGLLGYMTSETENPQYDYVGKMMVDHLYKEFETKSKEIKLFKPLDIQYVRFKNLKDTNEKQKLVSDYYEVSQHFIDKERYMELRFKILNHIILGLKGVYLGYYYVSPLDTNQIKSLLTDLMNGKETFLKSLLLSDKELDIIKNIETIQKSFNSLPDYIKNNHLTFIRTITNEPSPINIYRYYI